jgi:hypothetical protein
MAVSVARDDAIGGAGRRDPVKRHRMRARFLGGVLALVLGLTLVAPPAFAAEPATGAALRPIAAAANAKVEALPAEVRAQAAPAAPAAAPAETGKRPFFKTTKGAIALVLIAGTLGYTAYSMSNDRIKSPAK